MLNETESPVDAGRAGRAGPVGDDLPVALAGPSPHPTYDHRTFDAAEVARRRQGLTVSVVVPARDEHSTVGAVVRCVVGELTAAGGGADVVDEVVVVDDGSKDATAEMARQAGAVVIPSGSDSGGKGAAMAAGLRATTGEVVVFLDADVRNFGAHFVTGLLGPLVSDPGVQMVKAFYERPLHDNPSGGGRVTELVARPLIDLLFPELSGILQPLAGEQALRRQAVEGVALEPGYGVEIGLLVDVAERFGPGAVAQVDLGTRVHRNRPVAQLRRHATEVLSAGLARAGATLHT